MPSRVWGQRRGHGYRTVWDLYAIALLVPWVAPEPPKRAMGSVEREN